MQSVIHAVFIHQDEGGHYQEILHSTSEVNHSPAKPLSGSLPLKVFIGYSKTLLYFLFPVLVGWERH